jgi:hypothetical protein
MFFDLGGSVQPSMKRLMAAMESLKVAKLPRRMACRVMIEKKISTAGRPGLDRKVLVGGVGVHHQVQLPSPAGLGDAAQEGQELLVAVRRGRAALAAAPGSPAPPRPRDHDRPARLRPVQQPTDALGRVAILPVDHRRLRHPDPLDNVLTGTPVRGQQHDPRPRATPADNDWACSHDFRISRSRGGTSTVTVNATQHDPKSTPGSKVT